MRLPNEKTTIWDKCTSMEIGDVRKEFQDNNSCERLICVPDGWIYTYGDMQGTSSVFIPLIQINTL
jgi:hypothetical protein